MDNRQFTGLRPLLRSLGDERISVFGELISHKHAPKDAAGT